MDIIASIILVMDQNGIHKLRNHFRIMKIDRKPISALILLFKLEYACFSLRVMLL